ncbi:MAG: hypothetical protein U0W24_09930 [Bacteroidales bacterium]
MINYEYFDNSSLLIVKFRGKIDKRTLYSFIEFIYTKTNVEHLTKWVSDYRDSDLIFNANDLKDITELRSKYLKGSSYNSTVFLVGNPKDTVFSIIISENYYAGLSNCKICSTLETCLNFLSIDINIEEFRNRINNLKFEFKL